MLRAIFGVGDKEPYMASASTIASAEFKDALSRYPALIKSLSKSKKEGSFTLEELDHYRYIEAPANFSKSTGRFMEIGDVKKLVDWKLRHGTFRPSLPKLVASNSNEKIFAATKEAFDHYAKDPSDIKGTLTTLSTPLKGIGPATASLLLAVHDPQNVIFFSDEAYRWLITDGKKTSVKYNIKEFEELQSKAKALTTKLQVTPIEIEQVAFVIIKENEPVLVPKPKKEPSGLPRGRPTKPESEKKPKKPTVPGRGRGRPPKATNGVAAPKASAPLNGKDRDRPATADDEKDAEDEDEEVETLLPKGKRKATEEPDSAYVKKVKA